MKCNQCNIEMFVMARNNDKVVYQCSKCRNIANISIAEEKQHIEDNVKQIEEQENGNIDLSTK